VTTYDVILGASASSSAPFWFDVSATTTHIGNGGTGDSMVQLGNSGYEWTLGSASTTNDFIIASSTDLISNPAITIDKGTNKVTFGGSIDVTAGTNILISGSQIASTDLQDTANILYESELDSISELNTQIADATILISGGTLTDTNLCVADGTSGAIDCNVTNNSSNWNTAYGWGDHSTAGYLIQALWYATTTDGLAQGSTNLYNQTHTGEVTGATALTIADNIIEEANLEVTNSPTDNYILSYDSGSGGFTWVEDQIGAGGGAYAWTPDTTYNEQAQSTSSPIWLKETLYASSTSFFTGLATFGNISSTQLSATTLYGALTGNASTASTLQTARTIAGVSFDGSSNISIASTGLSDTADLLYETELDSFSELQTQIADATLLQSGGTLTTSNICQYDGTGIDCNIATIGTSLLTDDSILAVDLDATNTEADDDILTYDSGTGGFTFNTPAEIITAGTNLTWSGTTLNVDDLFTVTNASTTLLSAPTITNSATTTMITGEGYDFGNGTNGMRIYPGATTTLSFY